MTRKTDLEQHIRESYRLIREYEEIQRLSDDPKEQARSRRAIGEQRGLIEGYLAEYVSLCERLNLAVPEDIIEIAVTADIAFPSAPKERRMKSRSETESLKRRLAKAEENLRLVRERKSEYVQQTDVPLQIIKDERRLEQEIEELRAQLEATGVSFNESCGLARDEFVLTIPVEPPDVPLPPSSPEPSPEESQTASGKRGGCIGRIGSWGVTMRTWYSNLPAAQQVGIIVALIGLVGALGTAFIGVMPELLSRPTPTPTATPTPAATVTPTPMLTPTPTPTSAPTPTPIPILEFRFEDEPLCWSTRCYPGVGCYGGPVTQREGVLEFPIDFSTIPTDPTTPNLRKAQIQYTTESTAGLPVSCPKTPLTYIPFGSRFQAFVTIPPELQDSEVEFFVQTDDYTWYASRPTLVVTHPGTLIVESGTQWVRLIDDEEVDSQWDNRPILKFGIEFKMNLESALAQEFTIRIDNILVCEP